MDERRGRVLGGLDVVEAVEVFCCSIPAARGPENLLSYKSSVAPTTPNFYLRVRLCPDVLELELDAEVW